MTIKNIVFDIGNVIVRWDPNLISSRTFGEERTNQAFVKSIFPGDDIWLPLNKGEIDADCAMQRYQDQLGFTPDQTQSLWYNILDSMDLFPETVSLMDELATKGYRLFALSDNVHEIVEHLKSEFDFWRFFEGAVISAEIGTLKPDAEIFKYLLHTHQLVANETLFLDDIARNVAGAEAMGINGIQFSNAEQARQEMKNFGIEID